MSNAGAATPGPWKVMSGGRWPHRIVADDAPADVAAVSVMGQDGIVNARLIAAAPTMLDFFQQLKRMEGERDEHGTVSLREPFSWESVGRIALDFANAAIARAEGRDE